MSLFQRAHDIVAAKANKALDAAEKPDEMLDLSYNQMLDQITRIRRALVDIAASRKQIELQETQLQHSVDHLNDQAKAALAAGREDLAREALSRKAAAQGQINEMEPQHQQLTEEEEKLGTALAALQEKVNHFRSQKEVLKAQYTAASAMSSINESAAGISTGPARWTSCSSPACSRTSAAGTTTSRRNSTPSPRQTTWTVSWPHSRPSWVREPPRPPLFPRANRVPSANDGPVRHAS